MPNTPPTGRHTPPNLNDIHAAAARLRAFTITRICARCQPAVIPLSDDANALLTENARLHRALASARLESANRLAAIRAALGAAGDGETDPLDYLRWELADPGQGCR